MTPSRLRSPGARTSAASLAPAIVREAAGAQLARVTEQLYQLDLYATQFNRLYDPAFGWLGGGLGFPADRRQDRTGAPLPWLTEDEWRMHVAMSRDLVARNHIAIGFRDHLRGYIGPVTVQFVKKGAQPGRRGVETDPDVVAVQEAWDEWCEENDWGRGETDREKECQSCLICEGEATLQFFRGAPGKMPAVRRVEPELIRKPQVVPDEFAWADEDDWRWGFLTRPDDAETLLAMWVADVEGTGGRVVPADRFVRTRGNVVRSIKRGMSDFFPTAELLRKTAGLLDNMAHVARLQAAIAWWEQFSTATQAQILAMAESLRNPIPAGVPIGFGQAGTTQPPSNPFGPPLAQEHYPAGSIPRTDAGRSVLPGPVSQPGGFIEVERVVMRSVAFRFGLPSSFTSEGADSYASALVMSSPLVNIIQDRQEKQQGFTLAVVNRVLALGELSGRLPRGISARVRPLLTSRPVIVADEEKKARTRIALLNEGLDDPFDIIKDNGHDVDVCLDNQEEFRKRRIAMGAIPDPAAPQAPGQRDPSATPPGSAGGDGSSPNRPASEAFDPNQPRDDAGRWRAETLMGHAAEALALSHRDVARAHDTAGGPLKALRRAAALHDAVSRTAALSLRLRAKSAALTPEEGATVERAVAHMEAHRGQAEAALARHALDYAATLPDAPPVTDPRAAARTVVVDLSDYPPALAPAVEALAAKTGHVQALALGNLRLVARPAGELARVWSAVNEGTGFAGEPTSESLEEIWAASKAPEQVAVAGAAAGDPEAPRYKRLSRDLLLRYDPAAAGYRIVSRAESPETVGAPTT
jgi:hypothetical protein